MKRLFRIVLVSIIMAVSFGLISSCDNSTGVYGIDVVFPDSAVDFTSHVQPFLKKNCAYSGCHSSITMAGGLSMEDYFSIMTFPGLIIPENPNSSILNQILEGVLPHGTIFYSGYITQNQIQGMRTWVLEGAKLIP